MALWMANTPVVELWPNASEDDLQTVIRAVYKQVLGNAHVMESQRLDCAESQLRNGDITVRGFVRMVAQSELYQSLFFETSSPYRFVELNCKHLLGRAPHDQAEISSHVQTYNAEGYRAEIDRYLDSAEYLNNFGENTVPFATGTSSQAGQKNVGFNRSFALMRGNASHSAGQAAQLISDLGGNRATAIKGLATGGAYTSRAKRFRITSSKSNSLGRLSVNTLAVTVGYEQLSARIKGIQKAGGTIVSIVEAV
jgi:phycoerythrin-associated linker protein